MNGPAWFAVASGVAFGAAFAATKGDAWQSVAGWALAFANGLAGWVIDMRAVRLKGEGSVLASLSAHAVRAMALLLVIAFVWMRSGAGSSRFVYATLASYFVFLFAEIARMARVKE